MRDGAEILIDEPLSQRGRAILKALAQTMPPGSVVTKQYSGKYRLLVLYGVGLKQRLVARKVHLLRGGHVAMWDLGYWDRDDGMRLAIDSFHPTVEQLALAPEGSRRYTEIREDGDPEGPVLLIGIGRKSARMFGLQTLEWESAKLAELEERFPHRPILWRPKGAQFVVLNGTSSGHGLPLEDVLKGCSLVVCRHSNVAVDACIAGVSVECEDGAARVLYAGNPSPTPVERAEFLRRLAWFNWRPGEAPQAWEWMQRVIA